MKPLPTTDRPRRYDRQTFSRHWHRTAKADGVEWWIFLNRPGHKAGSIRVFAERRHSRRAVARFLRIVRRQLKQKVEASPLPYRSGRFSGLCPACGHTTEGLAPGTAACKWGGCNGTPVLR